MSLRMNLYGWSLDSFLDVLGSKNAAVLKAASAHLTESYPDKPEYAKKAKAWLRTLINTRVPLQRDRKPLAVPDNGGLMMVQMETELYAWVTFSILRAIAREDHLNPATQSYKHPSIRMLWDEFINCRFVDSKECPWQIHWWMGQLEGGTPLFGDGFRTSWSYYTIFTNADLGEIIRVFHAGARFKRKVPRSVPKEVREKLQKSLSRGGKEFIADLMNWFGQIHKAGQDAFIMWW